MTLPEVIPPHERVLDWVGRHDPRSLDYGVRATAARPDARPRSYTWACQAWLDQLREGACVGFAWAHEMAARPVERTDVTAEVARAFYRRAQHLDGQPWPVGTSVLAGAKAVVEAGGMTGYRWSFSVSELAWGVGHQGPAVLGIPWHESMFTPDDDGLVEVAGDPVSGHAIVCRGVSLRRRRFRLRNSWSSAWGLDGDCEVSFDGMERLLSGGGESCFAVGRQRAPLLRVAA